MKRLLFFCLLMAGIICCPSAEAQITCSPTSVKLACVIPNQLFLQGSQNLGFLNESVGSQLGDLPLASPASGIIYTNDPKLNLPVPSNDTLGPVLTQRAETIGRHKVYLALTYQFFRFEDIDGISMKHIPILLSLQSGGQTFETTTTNRLDLTAHQFGVYLTYGLTSRIDISIAMPVLDVHERFTTTGFEYPPSGSPTFIPPTTNGTKGANGIGDQVLAIKGTVWKPKQGGIAIGAEIRLPTGDAMNFLGSGTVGFKPFVSLTYGSRISPHLNFAYELNGHSILVTDAQGGEGRLPNRLIYSGGADFGLTKWMTIAGDLMAQTISNPQRIRVVNQSVPIFTAPVPTIQPFTASYNRMDFSGGLKVKPFGNLVLTGNVMVKLNQGGLRSRWVPFAGVSYTF